MLLLLLCFSIYNGYSQKLPSQLAKQPDGITIRYFDYSDQKNLIASEVFLGKNLKFKLPIRENFDRVDISQKIEQIEIIQKYLTANLIEDIHNCCNIKNCPDTFKGYVMTIKKGSDIKSVLIDYNFMTSELCGSDDLQKIIESFKNI
ncbi:MAG: hypothetical protein EOP00_34635 [Pedobacter sp.]|nr:MAG: hypothetical protein EOP00_34635 [Pedobacter sp.]